MKLNNLCEMAGLTEIHFPSFFIGIVSFVVIVTFLAAVGSLSGGEEK